MKIKKEEFKEDVKNFKEAKEDPEDKQEAIKSPKIKSKFKIKKHSLKNKPEQKHIEIFSNIPSEENEE